MSDLAPMLIYSPPLYLRLSLTLSRDTLDSQTGRSFKSKKRNIEYVVCIEFIEYIQCYPQRMRLQRRLYGIYLVHFLSFRVPCIGQNWIIFVLNHLINYQNTQLSAKTKSKLQIVIFLELLGRLYSLILCGGPCISYISA